MAEKKNYPRTVLEDLSPVETRTLIETVKNYQPEDEPVVWPFRLLLRWMIAALIVAVCLWFLFGG